MRIFIYNSFILVFLSAFGLAKEWTKFRGPSGDGHVTVKSIPSKWSDTENIKWKVPVPGKGWSSPVISADKIYLTSAVAEGDNQDAADVHRELRVICYSANNGKKLWDTKVFDQKPLKRPIHHKNSHASPTAIVENERVYVHFGHMGSACLNLQGEVIWKNDELKYDPLHGNGGTPIIVDDLFFYSADALTNPFVVALDKNTGKVVWKKSRSETQQARKFSFSTPTFINMGGRSQIISPASGAVFSYDSKTGEELWSVDYGGWSVIPKPGVYKNMIYVGTGYERAHLLGIRVDEKSKGNVTESHVERRLRSEHLIRHLS